MDRTNRNCHGFSTRPEIYGTCGPSPEIIPDQVRWIGTLSFLSSAAFFEFLFASTRTVVIPSHLRGFPNRGVPAKLDLAVFVLFKARPPTHLFFRIIDQSIPLL